MDKSGRMTNILKREDFVNEQSLNEKMRVSNLLKSILK